MLRLAAVLYILIGTVFAGGAVTTILVLRMTEAWQIAGAFAAGCVLALPFAYLAAKKMNSAIQPRRTA